MDEARYHQQIEGLKKYSDIAEVPPDPYDIPAQLAYIMDMTGTACGEPQNIKPGEKDED